MNSGLDLDAGSGNAKYIVLGAIVLAFGIVGYLVVGGGGKAKGKSTTAARAVHAPVAAAIPASTPTVSQAAPSEDDIVATQTASVPGPTPAPINAAPEPTATDARTTAVAVPVPAVTDADANAIFATETEQQDASDVSATVATRSTPRPAVRPPAPPALDALHAWWRDASTHEFNVQYVGQAASEDALVFRFSKSITDSSAAAQHISVTSENGAASSGIWKAGSNPYVLVYQGVTPGRYLVHIDPKLASASGKTLGEPLQGVVYVQ